MLIRVPSAHSPKARAIFLGVIVCGVSLRPLILPELASSTKARTTVSKTPSLLLLVLNSGPQINFF